MRITKKNFQKEELLRKLFLTTRQKTKIRNSIAKIRSTDIKFSKAQISKIIQSGGFLVPLHPLTNIKMTKYFNYRPRFNSVFFTRQFT